MLLHLSEANHRKLIEREVNDAMLGTERRCGFGCEREFLNAQSRRKGCHAPMLHQKLVVERAFADTAYGAEQDQSAFKTFDEHPSYVKVRRDTPPVA